MWKIQLHQHRNELPFGSCSLSCNSLQVRAAIPALLEMKNKALKNQSHSGTCCPRALTPNPTGFHCWGILHVEKQAENPRGGQASNIENKGFSLGCVHLHITFQEENFTIPFFAVVSSSLYPPALLNYQFQGSGFSPSCAFLQAQSSPPPQAQKQQSWGLKCKYCPFSVPTPKMGWTSRAGAATSPELSPHPGVTSLLETILVLLVILQPCSPPWNLSFASALSSDPLPSDTTLLLSSPKTFLKHKEQHLWNPLSLMQLLLCISKQPGPDTEALFHLLQSTATNRLLGRWLERLNEIKFKVQVPWCRGFPHHCAFQSSHLTPSFETIPIIFPAGIPWISLSTKSLLFTAMAERNKIPDLTQFRRIALSNDWPNPLPAPSTAPSSSFLSVMRGCGALQTAAGLSDGGTDVKHLYWIFQLLLSLWAALNSSQITWAPALHVLCDKGW